VSFATTDMIMHNRRQRGQWLAEQQANSARELEEARRAAATGTVTEHQILLLNRERAAREAEEAKLAEKGIFARAKDSIFGGLSEVEEKGGKIGAAARSAQANVQEKVQEARSSHIQSPGVVKAVEEKVEEHRRTGERVEEVLRPLGGPLDREAEASVAAVKARSHSWTSWLTGR